VSFVLGVVIGVVIATAVLVPVLRSRSDSRIRSVELTASERTNDAVARFENTSSLIRTALDSLTVGVVVASAEGEVLFRNRVASGLTGALHADVLVDEAIDVHLRGALSGENRRQVIELFGPPSRVVLVAAYPIDEGGALATIEDITERSRLDAVRTDFVANISHELKTPVGALAVLAEALADETEP